MGSIKVTTSRVNDYIYDPLFVVSGEKDYYKAAMVAKLSSAKFAICPIFPSMFSDLPHKPRVQFVMRKTSPILDYKIRNEQIMDASLESGKVDVLGIDRHRFFHSMASHKHVKPIPRIVIPQTPPPQTVKRAPKKKHKMVQTQYRESSAQTKPWQPSYLVMDSDPELLMLDFLKWGSGLPAGIHEVQLIERARMKRTWENGLPPIYDETSLEKRRRFIAEIERDEWAFREQEIQDIQDLRMELLQQMLNEMLEQSKNRTEKKMKRFCEAKFAEKEQKIQKLRHKTERDLRKLGTKHSGFRTKYQKINIVEEHTNRKSELYGPLLRHGDHPKRWHLVIDEHCKKYRENPYRPQYLGVEEISTLPRWLDQATKIKESKLELPGTRLCFRETKWTTPVLKQLHEDLKYLRTEDKKLNHSTLLRDIDKEPSEVSTPSLEGADDWQEEIHQAAILVESVLRGRASQMLIFEGRDRCRELIQELRGTHALQEEDRIRKYNQRLEVKYQQRENIMCSRNISKLQETLNRLSGSVVGTLLDFLNKELRRLLEERRVHAMCMIFERERNVREAAEAGRRQTEIRRRLEHDEIFKQVVKVHQDTVDLYLQDIISEGMEFASEVESQTYIENLATKVDEQVYSTMDTLDYQAKEEIIANLVHNFLLPEVEKQLIRDKIKKKQHDYLKTAHETIYSKIDDLPKPDPKQDLQPSKKHKTVKKLKKQVASEIADLEKAVVVDGFDDLDLPETREFVEDKEEDGTEEPHSSMVSSVVDTLEDHTPRTTSCDDTRIDLASIGTQLDLTNLQLTPIKEGGRIADKSQKSEDLPGIGTDLDTTDLDVAAVEDKEDQHEKSKE